ncbi:MAG: hypothetical protein LBL25_02290, partial [Oscillospiraceae bacterium]|jgi:hypothetical protein|nr:hypothetical protein [Oscillospiraceae bacterium]
MEATISLAAFIFAIFTLLSIVNICYIQAKIGSSLASSAKELSQYSFLYYKFSIDKAQAALNAETAGSRATAVETIDGVGTMLDALSDSKSSLDAGSFGEIADSAGIAGTTVKGLTATYKEELKDPKTFIIGMAKLAGEEALEAGKNKLGQLMARALMQKNLIESPKDDADKFLRRYRIRDGLDGLDFDGSTLMTYGKSDEIQLVVTYDIEVVRLLDFDFHFTVTQCAKTAAWGNGVSGVRMARVKLGTGGSVWDLPQLERGKTITDLEKAGFTYTSDGNGFDGYDKAENQFIQVTSMYGESYKKESAIKSRLYDVFNDMRGKISRMGEDVTVKDRSDSNREKTFKSQEATRIYKIILVVPDNADLETTKKAAEEFERSQSASGRTVTVEVKTGYGSPTEKTAEAETEPDEKAEDAA